jgi:hypothetical protein
MVVANVYYNFYYLYIVITFAANDRISTIDHCIGVYGIRYRIRTDR